MYFCFITFLTCSSSPTAHARNVARRSRLDLARIKVNGKDLRESRSSLELRVRRSEPGAPRFGA